jgi:hypothetical protein
MVDFSLPLAGPSTWTAPTDGYRSTSSVPSMASDTSYSTTSSIPARSRHTPCHRAYNISQYRVPDGAPDRYAAPNRPSFLLPERQPLLGDSTVFDFNGTYGRRQEMAGEVTRTRHSSRTVVPPPAYGAPISSDSTTSVPHAGTRTSRSQESRTTTSSSRGSRTQKSNSYTSRPNTTHSPKPQAQKSHSHASRFSKDGSQPLSSSQAPTQMFWSQAPETHHPHANEPHIVHSKTVQPVGDSGSASIVENISAPKVNGPTLRQRCFAWVKSLLSVFILQRRKVPNEEAGTRN